MRGPKHAVAISGAASAALGLVVLMPLPAEAAGNTYYVAQSNDASCTTRTGTSASPFCTISAAVKVAAAGDTISVGAGTYPEQVTLDKADLTIVTASNAVVTGADSGSTPVRSYAIQLKATATGAQVRGFTVQDVKFAGIRVDGASGAVIDDVDVSGSLAHGVEIIGGSGYTVENVHSHDNTSIGIRLQDVSSSSVISSTTDHNHKHGVSVQGGSDIRVAQVTSFANRDLTGRTANGIDVNKSALGGAVRVTVEQNTTYGNIDSGIEVYQGSNDAVVRRNLSYDNGDHGIDISVSTGADVISNTVVGNTDSSGINVEGGATGTTLRNNIAVDNATAGTPTRRSEGNIRVEAGSTSGTTIDYDLVYNSSASTTMVEWNGADYLTLSALRSATGQESHGNFADPKFVSLSGRNLALTAGSPALDAADAGAPNWLGADRNGQTPIDQTNVPDTGAGSPTYADLGALEFTGQTPGPADPPPTAKLTASPSTVAAGGTVTLDASGSGDDKGISSYAFDCGNGSAVKTGTAKTATCSYVSAGSFTAKVTVKDTAGQTASATATITVTVAADAPPTAKLTASPSTVAAGGTVTLDASASSDDKGIVSYAFDCGNGTAVKTGTAKSTTCTYAAAGSFTAKVMVTDTAGKTAAATAPVTVTAVTPPPSGGGGGGVGGSGDLAPTAKLSAPSTATVGQQITLDASGSGDDKGISSYAFDCGNGTAVKTGTAKTATCSYASAGSFTAKVTVKDTAGQTATATTTVKVSTGATGGPSAMLTVNDTTVRQLVPVRLDASGSTAGSAAIEDYTFNCGKGGADRTSSTATTTCRYRARGTYTATVVVTDADGHSSEATVEITVRRGGNPTARLRLSDRHVQRGERIIADASHSFGDRWWPVEKVRISCAGHSKTAHTVDLAMRCSFRHLGVHRIRLTVWNNLGHRDTVVRRIWVRRG